jgi:hypothetical protein
VHYSAIDPAMKESSRDFGMRTGGENRTAQVGFRITF